MKKLLLTIAIAVAALVANAQLVTFGFSAPVYDNFNNSDTSAAIELIVLIPKNDTLRTSVGATVSPIDGSAINGVDYSFTAKNHLFVPGTTN